MYKSLKGKHNRAISICSNELMFAATFDICSFKYLDNLSTLLLDVWYVSIVLFTLENCGPLTELWLPSFAGAIWVVGLYPY